jgi:hypothetical protein
MLGSFENMSKVQASYYYERKKRTRDDSLKWDKCMQVTYSRKRCKGKYINALKECPLQSQFGN